MAYPINEQNKFLLSLPKKSANGESLYSEYGTNYNGYGYKDTIRHYRLTSYQLKKYNEHPQDKSKKLTEEEKKQVWANRLARLTGIDVSEALDIAEQKEDYRFEQIEELKEKQMENYSKERAKILNKIERSNPLRRIKNKEHASAIMGAHNRHTNTNYEEKLEKKKMLLRYGRDYNEALLESGLI